MHCATGVDLANAHVHIVADGLREYRDAGADAIEDVQDRED